MKTCLFDLTALALVSWREARGEGVAGVQAVLNVIKNRAIKQNKTPYEIIIAPWQFSSMTATGDPELGLWPKLTDVQWLECVDLSQKLLNGTLEDNTDGATFYYATTIKPPKWSYSMEKTIQIGKQIFMKEKNV